LACVLVHWASGSGLPEKPEMLSAADAAAASIGAAPSWAYGTAPYKVLLSGRILVNPTLPTGTELNIEVNTPLTAVQMPPPPIVGTQGAPVVNIAVHNKEPVRPVTKTGHDYHITVSMNGHEDATEAHLSAVPTEHPTVAPTEPPTEAPTAAPSRTPTEKPSRHPGYVSEVPTEHPSTHVPSEVPSVSPTPEPSAATEPPTDVPTRPPTEAPTSVPSHVPTELPTDTEPPTDAPTDTPSTHTPSNPPTEFPTQAPTDEPSTRTPSDSPNVAAAGETEEPAGDDGAIHIHVKEVPTVQTQKATTISIDMHNQAPTHPPVAKTGHHYHITVSYNHDSEAKPSAATEAPSEKPTQQSAVPTDRPTTHAPTAPPSEAPTWTPTFQPSTHAPSDSPTLSTGAGGAITVHVAAEGMAAKHPHRSQMLSYSRKEGEDEARKDEAAKVAEAAKAAAGERSFATFVSRIFDKPRKPHAAQRTSLAEEIKIAKAALAEAKKLGAQRR